MQSINVRKTNGQPVKRETPLDSRQKQPPTACERSAALEARQRATSDARQKAREVSDAKRRKEAAIRAMVRKEMEEESNAIRARAEAVVAAKPPPISETSAQAIRAGAAMQALAAFRAEEGLDAGRPPLSQVANRATPQSRPIAAETPSDRVSERLQSVRLTEVEKAKLELIQSLSEAKQRADEELREINARRAARHAEDRSFGRQKGNPRPSPGPSAAREGSTKGETRVKPSAGNANLTTTDVSTLSRDREGSASEDASTLSRHGEGSSREDASDLSREKEGSARENASILLRDRDREFQPHLSSREIPTSTSNAEHKAMTPQQAAAWAWINNRSSPISNAEDGSHDCA